MGAWRYWAGLAVILATAELAQAENYTLVEKPQVGDCFEINITMSLTGTMRVVKDAKPALLKLTADATHEFEERLLTVDTHGRIEKTARSYDQAKATITLEANRNERALRPERKLMVAQQYQGQALVYSPMGALTPDEFELTSGHFDTLSLPGLLPTRPVGLGDTWKLPNDVVQALCNFEGLTAQDLKCFLKQVDKGTAQVTITGTATGIDEGALVKVVIEASYQFNMDSHRLTALEWKQKDERGQGPASPATNVESVTKLTRAPMTQPQSLSDVALVSVPEGFEPPATLTQLSHHHDGKSPFDLAYPREWQIVGQMPDHVVLRLLDRGDFVCQVTISPWDRARPGEHLSPAAFREAMAKTPGWEQGDIVEDSEMPPENGYWIYRYSTAGLMDKLKVVQNFYIVAGPTGDQIVLAFTMTPAQAEKLGTRDLAIVRGVSFAGRKN
jgi:hypothetical protein